MMLPGEDEALILLQRLCERHGDGWVIQQASRMWREKDPIGALYGSLAKKARDRRPHPRGEMWTVEELEDAGWRGSIGEEDGPK